MDNVSRDVSRLGLILNLSIGQERIGPALHFKDFMYYYFSRFVTNLSHAFKDFSVSEIEEFNRQHNNKIVFLTKLSSLPIDGLVVPIPKGMVKSYRQTMDSLLAILASTNPTTISQDLQLLIDAMTNGKLQTLKLHDYTKNEFEQAKHDISRLFGKTGLTHSTAAQVLVSKSNIISVNQMLLKTTASYYPDVLSLNQMIKTVESQYGKMKRSDEDKLILSGYLMIMAYRLSIFAVIMDHIQSLEHGFVGSMNVLLQKL